MKRQYTAEVLAEMLKEQLIHRLNCTDPMLAPTRMVYQAAVLVVGQILREQRQTFRAANLSAGKKQVHYLSMEFLLGRSLRNCLYNLQLIEAMETALSRFDVRLSSLYALEPDAGLGNGGLGRLAACYLDAMAGENILATGYCILYEFGMFRQRIIDGWQSELPDQWLHGGEIWLSARPGCEVEVRFGGEVTELWENGRHIVRHLNYSPVTAQAYDILIPGYNSDGVSLLRVWRARTPTGIDLDSFNRGDYTSAFQPSSMGEAVSKVLYPNDNHTEGKLLRLRQQYFLCAASVADICRRHLAVYGTLDNFADKNAIHINDTHPVLAIPELMRFLLDDCGYGWDAAWDIVTCTFAYTNHTVMTEAMEQWDETLFKQLLPRIHSILCEINRRYCAGLYQQRRASTETLDRLSIFSSGQIRMANLAVIGSHSVGGVSELHSQILREQVFRDFAALEPDKFTGITNGIASRRWLLQANPALTSLIRDSIGEFAQDMDLTRLNDFSDDAAFLEKLAAAKRENKLNFCKRLRTQTGLSLDPDSIFDVQVKRLHEYKRQHMNALDILMTCRWLKDNPNADFTPRTFIFGAKAAPGYYIAKQIIKLICTLAEMIAHDPLLREKLRVVFLEEYNVTTSEWLMPASDISEQISLAGTEASGTGNMKLMLNGAVTLGTLDGANVEIRRLVGEENILLFGMTAEQVTVLRQSGYDPARICRENPLIDDAMQQLKHGIHGQTFPELYDLLYHRDPYLALADLSAYRAARQRSEMLYNNRPTWLRMSLKNTAESGFFCADRAVREYAQKIWGLW